MTYAPVHGLERDFDDMRAHGVDCVSCEAQAVDEARRYLDAARRAGMRLHIAIPEITERADLIRAAGLTPVDALMIGGAYRGLAIDRHLFAFAPGPQSIVIEPPVYNGRFAYAARTADGEGRENEPTMGHYFIDMPDPVRAEVIVPLRPYDGRQHLAIVPAAIRPACSDAAPEADSALPALPPTDEIRARRLHALQFDLSGLDGALLDRVGIAVYWPYHGTDRYWIFGRGTAGARAPSTREALRFHVRRALNVWREAAGGVFPSDTVVAARFGDECFYITGHLDAAACSYPLWDYSEPALHAFAARAGGLACPRTWGFPEVYGPDAYALWQYELHAACAELCGIVREEIARVAPGLRLFRNTTRMGIFDACNDRDGTGQELLARNLDMVHLDPYPVVGGEYLPLIPRDMSYCAGLARRYGRPLVPWMQAHTYGGPRGLQHVSPEQVDRMAEEQWRQGIDAAVWLGYGKRYTFPSIRPDSWQRAAAFHRRLAASRPRKPAARLAALRGYGAWSLSSLWRDEVRNPADWLLQQFLEVWAVERGLPYDVFEVPPAMDELDRTALARRVAAYPLAVSNQPFDGALCVGRAAAGETRSPRRADSEREAFRRLIDERLPPAGGAG